MDRTKSTTSQTALPPEGCDRAADPRPRYEPPRLVKRRSLVRGTGQYVSGLGRPDGGAAGGLPTSG